MIQQAKELLTKLYEKYNGDGRNGFSINFSNDREEKSKLLNTINYLEEKGLIKVNAQTSGFVDFKLTAAGIYYLEENH